MTTSPFLGMDPFLEEPSEWSSFHAWLITAISEQLADSVSPDFFVKIEQRVYITTPGDPDKRPIVLDVYVVTSSSQKQTSAGVAGVVTEPTLIEPIYEPETRDRYIEIRDTRSREVITTIELLSPFNKSAGTPGREAFLNKRKMVMASKVHWIEIDLLRAGQRPPEVSNTSDYCALLKRGESYGPIEVWYFDLRDRMPVIAVPLRPPFEDVPLDLQQAVDLVYKRAHYAVSIDYSQPIPQPNLRPADAKWAEAQLQAWAEKQTE